MNARRWLGQVCATLAAVGATVVLFPGPSDPLVPTADVRWISFVVAVAVTVVASLLWLLSDDDSSLRRGYLSLRAAAMCVGSGWTIARMPTLAEMSRAQAHRILLGGALYIVPLSLAVAAIFFVLWRLVRRGDVDGDGL